MHLCTVPVDLYYFKTTLFQIDIFPILKVVSTIKCVKPLITSFTSVWNRERYTKQLLYIIFTQFTDFLVKVYLQFQHIMTGKIEDVLLIHHLVEGIHLELQTKQSMNISSYLQTLVPHFNEVIQRVLIDHLKMCADGQTTVDMKELFAITASQVISWVEPKYFCCE